MNTSLKCSDMIRVS